MPAKRACDLTGGRASARLEAFRPAKQAMEASTDKAKPSPVPSAATVRGDLMALTKFRLSLLVITTTVAGYLAGCNVHPDWGILLHTLIGTAFSAFGASVFNQLMEIEPDAVMKRTMDRPLPARRMPPGLAFGIGCRDIGIRGAASGADGAPGGSAAGLSGGIDAPSVCVIYTPMKRRRR